MLLWQCRIAEDLSGLGDVRCKLKECGAGGPKCEEGVNKLRKAQGSIAESRDLPKTWLDKERIST